MTAAQIAATAPLSRPDPTLDRAMQLLLVEGQPVSLARLMDDLGQDRDTVAETVRRFETQGRLRRDERGDIIASGGVSVVSTEYELRVADRQFWTWCAKTGLGLLGALAAGGVLKTETVDSGRRVQVEFDGDEPLPTRHAVLWPSEQLQSSCSSAAGELCTTYTLFDTDADAAAWARSHGIDAEVVTVREATRRALPRYRHSLGPASVCALILNGTGAHSPGLPSVR